MGFITGPELAAMCYTTSAYVRVQVGRKKLNFVTLENEKGRPVRMFDTTDPINKIFIDTSIAKNSHKEYSEPTRKLEKKTGANLGGIEGEKIEVRSGKKNGKKDPPPVVEMSAQQLSADQQKALKLDLKKKELDVKKAIEQVEIERLKKEKMQGEVIPTEMVTMLFAQHFKNLTLKYKEEAEKIVSVTILQLGGSKKDKVEFAQRLEDSINTAIDEARELTKMDLDAIVKEYSVKRGRGEKIN